ncbi:MAG: hypothetical protein HY974_03120 [Candidatus Kerfeldbacteria bacterium]|nr:hypothetical protein [Candidatus Kerfeldbacteria bacterium]
MKLISLLKSALGQWLLRSELRRFRQRWLRLGRLSWRHMVDHLIPHQRNNYHPHALKHRVLLGYSVFLILLKVLAIILPVALPSSSLFSSSITSQNIVDLTNQTRKNLNLRELAVNAKLAQAAEAKAEDIITNQYFSHTSPSGVTPWDWLGQAGYDYLYAGENLAVHYTSAEAVAEGWLASPTHRANIVSPRYTEIGVGVLSGSFEGADSTIVVQMFGQPVSAAEPVGASPQVTAAPKSAAEETKPSPTSGKVAAAEVKAVPSSSPQASPKNDLSKISLPPVIYEESLKIKPQGEAYDVRLVVTGATGVTAQLGSQSIILTRQGPSDVWQGLVQYEQSEVSTSGEQLSVVAWAKDGSATTKPLAWVAPQVKTQQLYTFNEGSDKYAKFFGGLLTVHNLNDSVRQFYLYFMVFLGAALLLNIFIKIRVQYPSVINHTLLVIALALFLIII